MDGETREGDRGSGLPVESEQGAAAGARAELEEELLQEGAGLPLTDALDTGDSGEDVSSNEDESPLGAPAH